MDVKLKPAVWNGIAILGHKAALSFLAKYRNNRVPVRYEGGVGVGKVRTEV